MSDPTASPDQETSVTSPTVATETSTASSQPALEPRPKAKPGTIPNWLALLIIVAVFGGVYYFYNKLTAPHVSVFAPQKNGRSAHKTGPGG